MRSDTKPWKVERVNYPEGQDANFEIQDRNGKVVAQTFMREIEAERECLAADEVNCREICKAVNGAAGMTTEVRKGVVLKMSKWGRPIVYIAESSWYSGVTTNQCVFSSREEAVRWAKDQGRGFLDWNTWAPRGKYPDCEFDSEQFDPTFLAKWDDGFVRVIKTEVNGLYDWAANFRRQSCTDEVASGVE